MRSLITAALLVSSSFLYAEEATTLKQQLNASPDLLIIAEEGSASALYYGSEDMPLSTIGAMDRSCQGIGGVGIIGKQSVGALASELPNNESAQAYMNIFKNYPEKGVAIYNGWFRCIADKGSFAVKKQSQLPLLIIEENIASAHFEAFDNYKSFANENNSAFARLVDAAADCKADRGRGVIVGDFNGKIPVPVSSLFMATANG
ncbi:MAG: hypothetical protein U9Q62_08685, partial [Campylobacterota bacterium]|nr:hypothetical protein [Campylobacterota bacterium]